jgi:hypothetical protein
MKLSLDEGATEHELRLSRVYPDGGLPAEPILTSERMTAPPGVYVNGDGQVFVPAGDKILVLEEASPPPR